MKDYYYILGVTRTASSEEIKKAYRKLSLKFHPDKNDGDGFFEDRFKEINEAYEILCNSDKRNQYNTAFKEESANQQSSHQRRTTHSKPPQIILFTANKSVVAIGETILFNWHVENATMVELKPFGMVSGKGGKEVKIGGFNTSQGLLTKLRASNEDATLERELVINRRVEDPIYIATKKPKANSNIFTLMALGVSFFILAIFAYYTKATNTITAPHSDSISDSGLIVTKHNSSSITSSLPSQHKKGRVTKMPKKSEISERGITSKSKEGIDETYFQVEAADETDKETVGTEDEIADKIYTVVDQQPEFAGGMAALGQYLQKNLRYPTEAQRANVAGRVFVSFVVNTDGKIRDVRVLKGLGFGTNEEAVRVIESMPLWKPGRHLGRPVRVKYNLPINFTLE